MARNESARENLFREATALLERIELAVGGSRGPQQSLPAGIVIGFRAGGAASFFFGDDPVYQFNAAGELRRAFCDGRLYKAVRRRLVSLERQRSQGVVQLVSRELTDAKQREFTDRMQARLRELSRGLENGDYSVVGQVPAGADVLGRVRDWLATHEATTIAVTPRV